MSFVLFVLYVCTVILCFITLFHNMILFLDRDDSGTISYDEFLIGVRVSQTRSVLIVFDSHSSSYYYQYLYIFLGSIKRTKTSTSPIGLQHLRQRQERISGHI